MSLATEAGDVKVFRGDGSESGATIADGTKLSLVRVPILFKFNVGA